MPRRARLDAPATLHHVIVGGNEKRKIVDDDADRDDFVQRLGELTAATRTGVYAWVLMTNHAHIKRERGQVFISDRYRSISDGDSSHLQEMGKGTI
jgi:putative transposase